MQHVTYPRAEGARRVRAEGPITLEHASEIFPRDGHWQHVSPSTLARWSIGGKRGVRLDSCRVRGKIHTSRAAIDRFVEAVRAQT